MKASKWYRTKLVNVVNQEWHPNGSLTIRIYKEGWSRAYKFKVKDYGEKTEEILEDEEIQEAGG